MSINRCGIHRRIEGRGDGLVERDTGGPIRGVGETHGGCSAVCLEVNSYNADQHDDPGFDDIQLVDVADWVQRIRERYCGWSGMRGLVLVGVVIAVAFALA